MVYLVYSTVDVASLNIAESIKRALDFGDAGALEGCRHLVSESMHMVEVNGSLLDASFLDKIGADLLVLLHKHSSAEGVAAFTVHPEGNWTDETRFGGRPKELSVSSPVNMLAVLRALGGTDTGDVEITYEATHHGPLLKTPSMFVELGGNKEIVEDKRLAAVVGDAVRSAFTEDRPAYGKVALGVGGTHYPEKFTRLALEGKYAFAHMMPRYQIANVDMLGQAVTRSDSKVEVAVIEWKSIKGSDRERVIKKLEELGVDYERV